MATLALLLMGCAVAHADNPKPSRRPAGTPVIHSPAQDADTMDQDQQIRAAKRLVRQRREELTKARTRPPKVIRRADRALERAEAYADCMEEHGYDDGEDDGLCSEEQP